MSTTTSTYLSIENNLARYQNMVASEPAVKTATDYYSANIGNVSSISGFVNNYRLLSYALTAYGLGDQVGNKALVTKVLEGGYTSSKALANTLSNPNWKTFAKAFSYLTSGESATSSATSSTESDYTEQQLESQQGQQDVGVQLALYFKRVAPTISSAYNVLGDENLLEAFQTIYGVTLDPYASIETNASIVSKLMPMSDLTNSKSLDQLVERFTTQYTLLYGPGGQDASSPLQVYNSGSSTTSSSLDAATSIMSGIVSGNSSYSGSSTTESLSSVLLTSLQNLSLGG